MNCPSCTRRLPINRSQPGNWYSMWERTPVRDGYIPANSSSRASRGSFLSSEIDFASL